MPATERRTRDDAALPVTAPVSAPVSAAAPPSADPAVAELLALLAEPQGWTRLTLSRPRAPGPGDEAAAPRVAARPVALRGGVALQFTEHHATRDLVHNHPWPEGLAQLAAWLGPRYRHAHAQLADGRSAELRIGKRGSGHLALGRRPAAAAEAPLPAGPQPHDRDRTRWVDVTSPWLQALGVTTAGHEVIPAMARKWRQINRFVEIVGGAALRLPALPAGGDAPLTVVDFGAGKAYLTFALHERLRGLGLPVASIGVERRADLVAAGNRAAREAGVAGLTLVEGEIATPNPAVPERFDVMIALHACDTATDDALFRGIAAGARLLVCSPCCHRQLRPQLLSPHPLAPVLVHGIHAEQQAEMLTDSLRALLLEASGYDTQVFEFVALEHTRKNKMILATRRPGVPPADARAAALAQVQALMRHFGIRRQALLEHLGGLAPEAS